MSKRFLIRHLGNMGDLVFFVPPVLETLKKRFPDCHITFVTAWGFRDKKKGWGKRNTDGFAIHLMITNPHIDQLIHWHDTALSLDGKICQEDGQFFPTWNQKYYEEQKNSGQYDVVYELDFGLKINDNPIKRVYEVIGLPEETYTNYQIYLTNKDRTIAKKIMDHYPFPRIFLLEGLEGVTTRGWDPGKIPKLEKEIYKMYGVRPIWFGSKYIPEYEGKRLTLRENIACLLYGNVGIGVLSGPLHLAASVGLPTITLYADQPVHRAAPAYFLNPYISDSGKYHRTLLGPNESIMHLLKNPLPPEILTPLERRVQGYIDWTLPGKQATKSSLAVITVKEIITVLKDMLTSTVHV